MFGLLTLVDLLTGLCGPGVSLAVFGEDGVGTVSKLWGWESIDSVGVGWIPVVGVGWIPVVCVDVGVDWLLLGRPGVVANC